MYQKGNKELAVLGLYLGDYSKRLYLREIGRLSGLSVRTAQRTLKTLEKSGILRSELRGKNKYFFPNLENIQTKGMFLQAETRRTSLFLERYPAFKSFLKEMRGIFSAPIIVFGSFARFGADKMSDVDVLIVSDEKIELPTHLLPNKIHEIYVHETAFLRLLEKNQSVIKKVRETHIILSNHSFFVDWMWDEHAK